MFQLEDENFIVKLLLQKQIREIIIDNVTIEKQKVTEWLLSKNQSKEEIWHAKKWISLIK